MWICLAVIMLKCSVLHDIKSFIPDLSTTISQLSQVIPEVIHKNIHVERWQLLLGRNFCQDLLAPARGATTFHGSQRPKSVVASLAGARIIQGSQRPKSV